MDALWHYYRLISALCTALVLVLLPAPSNAAEAPASGAYVATVKTDGVGGSVGFVDLTEHVYAYVDVAQDRDDDRVVLSFAFFHYVPTNRFDYVFVQGYGTVRSTALSVDSASNTVRLQVTTPENFLVTRCVSDWLTGQYRCRKASPVAFDLTWSADGYLHAHQKVHAVTTLGPLILKAEGEYTSHSAVVSGSAGDCSASRAEGILYDSAGYPVHREFSLDLWPLLSHRS